MGELSELVYKFVGAVEEHLNTDHILEEMSRKFLDLIQISEFYTLSINIIRMLLLENKSRMDGTSINVFIDKALKRFGLEGLQFISSVRSKEIDSMIGPRPENIQEKLTIANDTIHTMEAQMNDLNKYVKQLISEINKPYSVKRVPIFEPSVPINECTIKTAIPSFRSIKLRNTTRISTPRVFTKAKATTQSMISTLFASIELRDVNSLKSLLGKHPYLVHATQIDETPLHICMTYGYFEIADVLIASGADVNAKNRYGSSPIYNAVFHDNPRSVEYILEKGADINLVNESGGNVLHYAAECDSVECMKLLINRGVEIDRRNFQGETPLFTAVRRGSLNTIMLLVENGASVNSKKLDGTTVMKNTRNPDIRAFLEEHGGLDDC